MKIDHWAQVKTQVVDAVEARSSHWDEEPLNLWVICSETFLPFEACQAAVKDIIQDALTVASNTIDGQEEFERAIKEFNERKESR